MIKMKRPWFHFREERRSKPFLLLEIGLVHARLHAIDASRNPIRIRMVRQEAILPGDASAPIEAARKALDGDSDIRDLAVAINSPLIRHHTVAIPPMNAQEREKIVRMEMKRFVAQGEQSGVVSCWPAGRSKENGLNKEYVLCADMPRALSEALIFSAREKKYNLIGLTSHPQLSSHLLKECRLAGVAHTALVEVNDHEGSITLFRSNIWNMERPFLIGGDAPKAPDDEKLKLEVGRALQYFKQQVRNENISRIFLYGTTCKGEQIRSLLETEFRIPVSLIPLDEKRFETNEPGRLFSISHVASLHSRFESYIDFLPQDLRRKQQIRSRTIAVAASAAALYAMLGGVSYLYRQEASKIEITEKTGGQLPLVPSTSPEEMRQIRKSRAFALAAEQNAEWMRVRHRALSGFARELAAAMPAEMRITAMEATEKENTWLVRVAAEIASPNGSRSREILLQFQERMKKKSGLNRLIWGEAQLADSRELPTTSVQISKPLNLLTFSFEGAVALHRKMGSKSSGNIGGGI